MACRNCGKDSRACTCDPAIFQLHCPKCGCKSCRCPPGTPGTKVADLTPRQHPQTEQHRRYMLIYVEQPVGSGSWPVVEVYDRERAEKRMEALRKMHPGIQIKVYVGTDIREAKIVQRLE